MDRWYNRPYVYCILYFVWYSVYRRYRHTRFLWIRLSRYLRQLRIRLPQCLVIYRFYRGLLAASINIHYRVILSIVTYFYHILFISLNIKIILKLFAITGHRVDSITFKHLWKPCTLSERPQRFFDCFFIQKSRISLDRLRI